MMTDKTNTLKNAGLALMLATTLFASLGFAGERDGFDSSEVQARMEALSYAPQDGLDNERFSNFNFEMDEYSEHELNDAWLGMPAYSSNNKLIGYVYDAILDEDGYVSQIVIGLNDSETRLEINAQFAGLLDEKVAFTLSESQIAALANRSKLASLQE